MRLAPTPPYRGTVVVLATVSVLATEAVAGPPCYTSDPNSQSATGAATAAGVSVVAANSSTAQILEMVAERREEQTQSCPAGYVSVGGACQPAATEVAAATPPEVEETALEDSGASGASSSSAANASSANGYSQTSAKASSSSAGASSPRSAGTRMKAVSKPSDAPSADAAGEAATAPDGPSADLTRTRASGAWLEGYGEKEQLSGLRIGLGDGATAAVTRDQTTAGFLTGFDRTIALAGRSALVVGALGGHSNIYQRFSPVSGTFNLSTNYDITPTPGIPAPSVSYDFLMPHDLTLSVEQEQQSDTVGVYGSYVDGGFFLDGLFSVDFRRLRQTTVRHDGYKHDLTGVAIGNDNQPTSVDGDPVNYGCIVSPTGFAGIRDKFGDYRVDSETEVQKARFENYVVAMNLGYHADLDKVRGTWWEPAGTITFTYADFGSDGRAMGLDDGNTLRLQGGARFGITRLAPEGRYLWSVSAGAYAYSDVVVDGYVIGGTGFSTGSAEVEEGLLRFLGTLRADLSWIDGYSWYAEADTRQGDGLEAYGGKIGGRIEW